MRLEASFRPAPVTSPQRHRAVDAYRAVAMVAVALGHWLAASTSHGPDGHLRGDNALRSAPSLAWLTLLFQVMPLFFCLGGYANAASLDAARRRGTTSSRWVGARVLRLTAPASVFAAFWLAVAGLSRLAGIGAVVGAASAVAAIPLWFLANYTLDVALAPALLRAHRARPHITAGVLGTVVVTLDVLRVFGGSLVWLPNVVCGWLVFQLLGFWWRDGLLPSPRVLRRAAGVSAAICASLVAWGPWQLAMIHVPGRKPSNTWPPSVALLAFGLTQCLLAISWAPAVNRWLESHARAWRAVVTANSMAMSVYLWHITALVVVVGAANVLGVIPSAPVGTTPWWMAKAPMVTASAVVLAAVLAVVARWERRALVAGGSPDLATGAVVAVIVALALSFEALTLHGVRSPVGVAGALSLITCNQVLRRAASGRGAVTGGRARRSPSRSRDRVRP